MRFEIVDRTPEETIPVKLADVRAAFALITELLLNVAKSQGEEDHSTGWGLHLEGDYTFQLEDTDGERSRWFHVRDLEGLIDALNDGDLGFD